MQGFWESSQGPEKSNALLQQDTQNDSADKKKKKHTNLLSIEDTKPNSSYQ